MAMQIANRAVVEKIETLARAIGLNKTAAVERAVDRLLAEQNVAIDDIWQEFDRTPEQPGGADPLEWDEHGLPR
jgi:antitoxin VapB